MTVLQLFEDDIIGLEEEMRICVPHNSLPQANPDYWDQRFYNSDSAAYLPNCYAFANNIAPVKFFPQFHPMFFSLPGSIAFWRSEISNDDLKERTEVYLDFCRQTDPYIRGDFLEFVELTIHNLVADGLTHLGYQFSLASHGSTLALFFHDKDHDNSALHWNGKFCEQHDYHFSAIRNHEGQMTWAEKRLRNPLSIDSPRGIFQSAVHFGYYHFAGYFHCPNDLGFPSVG